MTAPDAIRKVLSNYATFSGRASRAEYWWWFLFILILSALTALIDGVLFGFGPEAIQPISLIVTLGLILPSIAVGVRRLHDIGKSGWWYLIVVTGIGALVLIWFFIQPSVAGANEHGDEPAESAALRAG
jgi:uncharacterized membrane protein YhaH (DUF805 family)